MLTAQTERPFDIQACGLAPFSPDAFNLHCWHVEHAIAEFLPLDELWVIAGRKDPTWTAARMAAALEELDSREAMAVEYDERRNLYFCRSLPCGKYHDVDDIAEAVAEAIQDARKPGKPSGNRVRIAHSLREQGCKLCPAEAAVLSAALVLNEKFRSGTGVSRKTVQRMAGAYHAHKLDGQTGKQVLRRLEYKGIVRFKNDMVHLVAGVDVD